MADELEEEDLLDEGEKVLPLTARRARRAARLMRLAEEAITEAREYLLTRCVGYAPPSDVGALTKGAAAAGRMKEDLEHYAATKRLKRR